VVTKSYDVVEELRGDVYRGLLVASVAFCDRAVLVSPAREADICSGVVDALRAFVRVEFRSGCWPGTISWDDPALVHWLA
jgi:hypothetical protein